MCFEEDNKVARYDDESNKKRLKCLKCDIIVRKLLPFEPNNKNIKAFACDKVTVYKNHTMEKNGRTYTNLFL